MKYKNIKQFKTIDQETARNDRMKGRLISFNKKETRRKLRIDKIKEENKLFASDYKAVKRLLKATNTEREKDIGELGNKFNDLIKLYQAKDYKIPPFKASDNLFKSSPLLEENADIYDQFRYMNMNKDFERDITYLRKINKETKEFEELQTNVKRSASVVLDSFANSRNKRYLADRFESIEDKIKENARVNVQIESVLNKEPESSYEINREELNAATFHNKNVGLKHPRRRARSKVQKFELVVPSATEAESIISTINSQKNASEFERKSMFRPTEMNILTSASVKNKDALIEPTMARVAEMRKAVKRFHFEEFESKQSLSKGRVIGTQINRQRILNALEEKAKDFSVGLSEFKKDFLYYVDNFCLKREKEKKLLRTE